MTNDDDDIPPGLRRALERATDRTPPLGVAYDESAVARMYHVAKEVVDRERAAEWRDCENEPGGPVCKVVRRIDKLESDMETIKETLSEYRGQHKRDMLWLKMLGLALAAGTLILGGANWLKRDTSAATQAAIMHELRAMRTEFGR